MNATSCHCGKGTSFENCCKIVIEEGAASPELLMRSRYSAFVEKNVQYLVDTHHPVTRGEKLAEELLETCEDFQWLSLYVISTKVLGDEGEVEFVAYARQTARFIELHERSVFLKENDKWYYVKGEVLPHYPRDLEDDCWCGCGKKLKQCQVIEPVL